VDQTNADRPGRPGEVGAYNDAFFERGRSGVKSRRTSLVIDPPDGRIPALTAEAQRQVDAREKHEAASPADGPEDRWLTERCILFGATVPMLPEPYNNNYTIVQTPDYVIIRVEMNHDTRIIPLDGRPHVPPAMQQWIGDSRGRWEGPTLVVETRNLKFNEKSRFGVGYLNGLSDGNLRVVERFTRTDADTITYQATIDDRTVLHAAVDGGALDGPHARSALRSGLPRRQLRDVQHPLGPPRRRTLGPLRTRTAHRYLANRLNAGSLFQIRAVGASPAWVGGASGDADGAASTRSSRRPRGPGAAPRPPRISTWSG
jgi:hypothetical protein